MSDPQNPWGSSSQSSADEGSQPKTNREWLLIEKLLSSAQNENRKTRRWGVFFKFLTFGYLFLLLFIWFGNTSDMGGDEFESHTALIDIKGVISDDSDASADVIVTGLREAFETENAKAILLRINSPGGSPVQSGYVYDEIQRLRVIYPDKPVYAVIQDVGASGAYYIAAAADEIYVDKASIVGSIGVIMGGFGFEKAIDKLGVERRVMTAGSNKDIFDPFKPVVPAQKQHLQGMLDVIHLQFIDAVKQGRGDRLANNPEIFSGLFWSGERSVELGLADGLGSPSAVARDVIRVEDIVDYTPHKDPVEQLLERFGVSFGEGVAMALGLKGPMLQ